MRLKPVEKIRFYGTIGADPPPTKGRSCPRRFLLDISSNLYQTFVSDRFNPDRQSVSATPTASQQAKATIAPPFHPVCSDDPLGLVF